MIFEVDGGGFGYDKKRNIFENINVELFDGEILSILGPNGAGKTTFLKCIMGLLKWKNGGAYLNGKDILQMPYKELWKALGYVPQVKDAYHYTVEEMVLFGRNAHLGFFSQPSKKDCELAEQAMRQTGIIDFKGRICSSLSGGELQLVLIARALAVEPKILILDEPESNLDFKNQSVVLNIITSLAKTGICCIFNTHYPNHALKISDKTLMLGREGISIFGETRAVITEESIEKVFGVRAMIQTSMINDTEYSSIICLS